MIEQRRYPVVVTLIGVGVLLLGCASAGEVARPTTPPAGVNGKAYPYPVAAREQVINDEIGGRPVLVFVDPETHAVSSFFRLAGEQILSFALRDGQP